MDSASEAFRPGRLWSLWDIMQRIHFSAMLALADALGDWGKLKDNTLIDKTFREQHGDALRTYERPLLELGLAGPKATLSKMVSLLSAEGCENQDLAALAVEMSGRLIDETKEKIFFAMTMRESESYANPRKGWDASIARFPSIVDDVEEAAKCYALSRYPAAVFHSVQILEAGLIELGTFLKVSDPFSGWTAVSQALIITIKKTHQQRTRFERKHFFFLEQLQGTVEGLKNAWRNKISHAQGRLKLMPGEFSPEVAEEILLATRAFMRRLAEGLPPAKTKPGQLS